MGKKVMEIQDLIKIYSLGNIKVPAITGVDLEVCQGEFVSIMGPSGSGKSTLMNIIGCLDTPTKGRYWLDGIEVSKVKDSDLAEVRNKKIGFVFQTFNLLTRTNVIGNIELPLIYSKNGSSKKRKEIVSKVIEAVGLKGRERHKPSELSGGQRQRVAIARALVNDPAIILADEPTGNLDSRTGEEIMAIFQDLNQKGKTILIVTHEMEIARHTKRIIYLKDGKITGDEKVEDPVSAYDLLLKLPSLKDKVDVLEASN